MVSYLQSEVPTESEFAKERIAKGACFLAVDVDEERFFFPSRFLGYKNNSIEMHFNGTGTLDGKLTNPAISRLLGAELETDEKSESDYLIFCSEYGIRASRKKRSYWKSREITTEVKSSISAFYEGKAMLKETTLFQRSSALVKAVKASREPICECCQFDFQKIYGERAKGYIECNHLTHISKRAGRNVPTTLDEVALLCANCHRMVHRTREGLTLDELRAEMKKASRAKRA